MTQHLEKATNNIRNANSLLNQNFITTKAIALAQAKGTIATAEALLAIEDKLHELIEAVRTQPK